MPTKEKLRDVIRTKIKSSGTTQSGLTKELELDYDSLRTQLTKNTFIQKYALVLGKALGIGQSLNELQEKYEFNISTEARRRRGSKTKLHSFDIISPLIHLLAECGAKDITLDELHYIWKMQQVDDVGSLSPAAAKALIEHRRSVKNADS